MKILAVYLVRKSGIQTFCEPLINYLSTKAEVDVLCDEESWLELKHIRNYYRLPFTKRMQSAYRILLDHFDSTIVSDRWSKNALKMIDKDYDAVIAFVASSQLTAIIAGKYISQQLGSKFAIYAVDAIPAPGGWIRHKYQFKAMQKVIGKVYSAADYVTASNKHMLEYQLTQFKHKEGLMTDVLLTPAVDGYYKCVPSNEVVFLYAGALYGLRNPEHFLKAFKRLLKIYPKAEFCIVGGVCDLRNIDQILTPEERTHVVTLPRTFALEPLFARAKVLVDIDADLEKDPFLSSKIVTYLKVNRVILSETGRITPSREMFAGLNTVVQCDHNEESLYQGMLRAIELADSNPDFSEREPYIESFAIDNVSEKLWCGLKKVCGVKEE